jgi:hypothetical protein
MDGIRNANGRLVMPPGGFPPMQPAPPPEPMLRPAEGDRRKAKPRKAQGDRWALLNGIVDGDDWAEMTPTEAKVLMFLFRHAMGDKVKASLKQIAQRNGISWSTAKRAVLALERRGLLKQISTGSNLTHEASTYQVRRTHHP